MLISVTMPIIVSILTFMSKINTPKSLKARISCFLWAVKSSSQLSWAWKSFITGFWSCWIMHALHLSLICVILNAGFNLLACFFHKQGKWKKCGPRSARSLAPSELELPCFQDLIYWELVLITVYVIFILDIIFFKNHCQVMWSPIGLYLNQDR